MPLGINEIFEVLKYLLFTFKWPGLSKLYDIYKSVLKSFSEDSPLSFNLVVKIRNKTEFWEIFLDKILWHDIIHWSDLFFKINLFIHSFMKDMEREAETQAEGEAGPLRGARRGTRSQDPGVTPLAESRCSTAESPRRPDEGSFYK